MRRPPRSTLSSSSAASDVYKRQYQRRVRGSGLFEMPLFPTSELYRDSYHRFVGLKVDDLAPDEEPDEPHTSNLGSSWPGVRFACTVVLAPIAPVLLLVSTPLQQPINPWLFCIFQSVYCLIGLPLILFLFEFMLASHSRGKWPTRIAIAVAGQLMIFPFNFLTYCHGKVNSKLVRALGPCLYAGIVMATFLVATHSRWSKDQNTESRPELAADCYYDSTVLLSESEAQHREHTADASTRAWGRLTAFGYSVALLSAVFAIFLFCQWFAVTFEDSSSSGEDVALMAVFLGSVLAFRFCFTYIGRYADRLQNYISLEMCIVYVVDCFYFVFFRNLFVSVRSWESFFLVKALHLVVEGCSLSRLSTVYFNWSKGILLRLEPCRALSFLQDPSTLSQWRQRLIFGRSLRWAPQISSGISFMLLTTVIRRTHESSTFHVFGKISETQYVRVLEFTVVSMVLEAGVAALEVLLSTYAIHEALYLWGCLLRLVW
eukprot:TRINITY_DN9531_c0_g2_i5.p1 TRINITY_DN9531_c0_g2~~TRINITY_DN9531_c0_g2_i5.p1  ORF type:complete len:488 (+),score=88.66 TRINITY_DN9531_c0_g2_i5:61-1524(+)